VYCRPGRTHRVPDHQPGVEALNDAVHLGKLWAQERARGPREVANVVYPEVVENDDVPVSARHDVIHCTKTIQLTQSLYDQDGGKYGCVCVGGGGGGQGCLVLPQLITTANAWEAARMHIAHRGA
jgi:hypothetical protein